MPTRLPFTLWLYVLTDLWKLVGLTTGVLVTVIAFAAAIKPLADGKLGPEDTLQFMFMAMVPMLQYALPFAACFGATLAYHRLATDNELTAVHAGGVSHRAMLIPAVLSGLLLAGVLLTLSNSVIPRFLKGMATLVAEDAAKIIVNHVQRGESIKMGNTYIFADRVERLGPDELSGAYDRLWLSGLLVVRTNDKEEIESQGSASSAAVWLKRTNVMRGPSGPIAGSSGKPMTEVIIKPSNSVGLGSAMRGASSDMVMSFLVPNPLSDNVKFLSFSELRALRAHPESIDRVDKSKRTLALMLAERITLDEINDALRRTGEAKFLDPFKQPVLLRASGLRPTRREGKRDAAVFQILPPTTGNRKIVVETTLPSGKGQPQLAEGGFIRLPTSANPERGATTVTMQLLRVYAEKIGPDGEVDSPDESGAGRGELEQRLLPDLSYTGEEAPKILGKSTADVETLADQRMATKPGDQTVLAAQVADLHEQVGDLFREVLSKEQERYAMSIACLVMVLVGSVMAMRLREALPLTVYLWAFFPALACVLAISGGQQLTHGKGLIGLPVLWAGVGALGAFAIAEFVRLCKH